MPGPSVIPDRVLAAMHRAMPNIYEGEMIDLSFEVLAALPRLARTTSAVFITISNGHGAWEMALTNVLSRGDHVLVLGSGRFAEAWGDMAATLGAHADVLAAPSRHAVDGAAVEARLRADTAHRLKAVLMVQVDTASSVLNDVAAVRGALDAAGHPALLAVDCIASLGCERYEMDAWGVDVTVAASQKGLMVPPGLGFVWAGPRALAAHEHADMVTGYWDWSARTDPDSHYQRYCGTPPIQHLYAMRESIAMLDEEGLEAVWQRHGLFAAAVHAAVQAWSTPGGLEFEVLDPDARSNAVTTVRAGSIDATRLRALCDAQGLTLGLGLEGANAFRIGHMGHLNPPTLLGVLATIESALTAMDAPVGVSGVAAATQVVGEALRHLG